MSMPWAAWRHDCSRLTLHVRIWAAAGSTLWDASFATIVASAMQKDTRRDGRRQSPSHAACLAALSPNSGKGGAVSGDFSVVAACKAVAVSWAKTNLIQDTPFRNLPSLAIQSNRRKVSAKCWARTKTVWWQRTVRHRAWPWSVDFWNFWSDS